MDRRQEMNISATADKSSEERVVSSITSTGTAKKMVKFSNIQTRGMEFKILCIPTLVRFFHLY